jgi:hypothetical protein
MQFIEEAGHDHREHIFVVGAVCKHPQKVQFWGFCGPVMRPKMAQEVDALPIGQLEFIKVDVPSPSETAVNTVSRVSPVGDDAHAAA